MEPPTFGDTPKEQVGASLSRYCMQNEDAARKAHYDECDLYYFGEFDDNAGKFNLMDQPEFVISLSRFFPPVVPPEPAKFSPQDIQQLAATVVAYIKQEIALDKQEMTHE